MKNLTSFSNFANICLRFLMWRIRAVQNRNFIFLLLFNTFLCLSRIVIKIISNQMLNPTKSPLTHGQTGPHASDFLPPKNWYFYPVVGFNHYHSRPNVLQECLKDRKSEIRGENEFNLCVREGRLLHFSEGTHSQLFQCMLCYKHLSSFDTFVSLVLVVLWCYK